MKPTPGSYVFQSADHHDRKLRRLRTITRRRVLSVTADRVALAGAERLTVFLDDPVEDEWQRGGMMLSRDICLSWDALAAQGWKTGFTLRGAA